MWFGKIKDRSISNTSLVSLFMKKIFILLLFICNYLKQYSRKWVHVSAKIKIGL